jgi:hypothetical protein
MLKPSIVLILAFLSLGCVGQNDVEKLNNAKQLYNTIVPTVTLLIQTGYIANNDQGMKDLIWSTSEQINKALDEMTLLVAQGQHAGFQFYLDQSLQGLQRLLIYKTEGLEKHKKSNPSTRPVLPQGVSYGRSIGTSGESWNFSNSRSGGSEEWPNAHPRSSCST